MYIYNSFEELVTIERLDKTISNIMCISRSDARRLIKIGKVFVNGEKMKAFDTKISESDEIVVDGEKLSLEKNVYIIMNKAAGVVCDDKSSAPYAIETLPKELKRKDLFCVGRLDKDTTGLLLITNDGEFSHSVISPKKHIEKRYRATLQNPITENDIAKAKQGITLKDGTKLLPSEIFAVTADNKTVDFVIFEGKYHQIKRMAGALDNKILSLHRYQIGELVLPKDLDFGEAKKVEKEQAFLVFKKAKNCQKD